MDGDEHRGIRNVADGTITGPFVQAGVIHGGITVHNPSESLPVPRQLPPSPPNFTNRSTEAAILDAVLHSAAEYPGAPKLAVLVGAGGVGKSALAIWWGTNNADNFADGQLYADLRGFSVDDTVLPEETLARFLRDLGVPPARVPVELAELTALYRSVTSGRRLLVVLDNAFSAAQVRPLLPTSGDSMVLVTSRLRLGGLHNEGAVFVDLTPLPHEDAVDMLAHSLGRTRVVEQMRQVGELVSLCGRLPIAIRVVGARLASRPKWRVDRLVTELADEQQRLARLSIGDDVSVRAAFDLSYQALDDTHARLYRLTSLHPGPFFSAEMAASAADIPVPKAETGLQELVDASLVEEIGDDTYRYHDLVKLHGKAYAETQDKEPDGPLRRIADWLLRQVTRANMVVIPNRWRVSQVWQRVRDTPPMFSKGSDAVEWLDTQLPNVIAVLNEAAKRGWDELAWQLCESLWELLLHRKHYQIWLSSHEVGVHAAHRCGDVVAESRLRCQLGRAYLDLHDFDAAERECRTASDLARAAGSRLNESVAVNQLGLAAQGRGDIDTAIGFFEESLAIETELGIERGVALRHRRIGEALAQARRDDEAAVRLTRAREMFAELSDEKDEAKTLVALARIAARQSRPDLATRQLREALTVLRSSGSAVYHAEVLIALAEVSRDNDDPATARSHLLEALELSRLPGGPLPERIAALLAELPSTGTDEPEFVEPPSHREPQAPGNGR